MKYIYFALKNMCINKLLS